MGLCVIIGSGPVGEHVAKRIQAAQADEAPTQLSSAAVIGLEATQPWLSPIFPSAEFITALDFGKAAVALSKVGATEVIFTGSPFDSIRCSKIDSVAMLHLFRRMSLWIPHAYLYAIQDLLADNQISLGDPLNYFPELRAQFPASKSHCAEYSPLADFKSAVHHITRQHWTAVRQSYIVDAGEVLLSESKMIGGTNALICKFGSSAGRQDAKFPVLCKVAVPPFERIDVPTIGSETIRLCMENGIRAIVIEREKTIVMQPDQVAAFANAGSICLYAL